MGKAVEAQLSREDDKPTGHHQQSSETTELNRGGQHGHDRWEGSPSLRGCEDWGGGGISQAPTQLNDQPQADDADSHQVMLCLFTRDQLLLPLKPFSSLFWLLFPCFPLLSLASSVAVDGVRIGPSHHGTR